VRSTVQRAVVRWLARRCAIAFSTLEPNLVRVFRGIDPAPRFLPVGSNVPVKPRSSHPDDRFVISVFGLTEGNRDEALMLAEIVRRADLGLGTVSLQVFGRGALEAQETLRSWIRSIPLTIDGVIEADEVSSKLASSDALLFVRGEASSRRGTIVAAICNGLPVVAQEGPETGSVIREAGVRLFPKGDRQAAADELVRLGSDPLLAQQQGARQHRECESTFSWPAIAARLVEALRWLP
jgi:glycosyltransferase involved in cell wall biosynthesis